MGMRTIRWRSGATDSGARSARSTREELAVFGGAFGAFRSSAPLEREVARSSSIVLHAGGLEGPWVHDFKRAAQAAARKDAEAFSLVS